MNSLFLSRWPEEFQILDVLADCGLKSSVVSPQSFISPSAFDRLHCLRTGERRSNSQPDCIHCQPFEDSVGKIKLCGKPTSNHFNNFKFLFYCFNQFFFLSYTSSISYKLNFLESSCLLLLLFITSLSSMKFLMNKTVID